MRVRKALRFQTAPIAIITALACGSETPSRDPTTPDPTPPDASQRGNRDRVPSARGELLLYGQINELISVSNFGGELSYQRRYTSTEMNLTTANEAPLFIPYEQWSDDTGSTTAARGSTKDRAPNRPRPARRRRTCASADPGCGESRTLGSRRHERPVLGLGSQRFPPSASGRRDTSGVGGGLCASHSLKRRILESKATDAIQVRSSAQLHPRSGR